MKMTKKIAAKQCKVKPGGAPIWFNLNGAKMEIRKFSPENRLISIKNSAAEITIRESSKYNDFWDINWEIKNAVGFNICGSLIIENKTLQAMFAIIPDIEYQKTIESFIIDQSQSILDFYGGDFALVGNFIRWKDHLNIPGPGTGFDCDPNISLVVTKDIWHAIGYLTTMKKK